MPSKKLLIITALLVVGALAVTFADRQGADEPKDPRVGEKVFTGGTESIDKIVFTQGENTLQLVKADGWYLESAAGFPVDAEKVLRFFERLSAVKLVRRVTDQESQFAEFGLDQPTAVSLMAGDKQVLDLRLGKRRTGGGLYVSIGGEYKGYLADPEVDATLDEANWELRTLVDVRGDEVKRIEFLPRSGDAVVLSREKKEEDLKVEGLTEAQTEISGVSAAQATLLQGLKFAKRYDVSNAEASAALASPSIVKVATFAGRNITLRVGDTGGEKPKHFVSIEASGGDAAPANERLTRMMKGWRFEIPSYVGEKFVKNRGSFVKASTAGSQQGSGTPGKG